MKEMVAAMCLLFSEINKRGLRHAVYVAVSKHVNLYGPWTVFQYYNLTSRPTPSRGLLPDATHGCSEQYCGCESSTELSRRYDVNFTE